MGTADADLSGPMAQRLIRDVDRDLGSTTTNPSAHRTPVMLIWRFFGIDPGFPSPLRRMFASPTMNFPCFRYCVYST